VTGSERHNHRIDLLESSMRLALPVIPHTATVCGLYDHVQIDCQKPKYDR
jgi:hypothetical protein